jgi:chromosome segregation ATPase
VSELDDLEIGVGRLKEVANDQKKQIEELNKERALLVKKNNEISESIKRLQDQIKPTSSELREIKKDLEEVAAIIQEMKRNESKLESMITEQRSNLFLMKSNLEKNLDRVLGEIEDRIKENKRIELTRFNELKSKIERMSGLEEGLRDQSKYQKEMTDRLSKDISNLQQTIAKLTSLKLDSELDGINKRIALETKSLIKQISGHSETILGLRDRLQYFEPVVKELSEKLASQAKASDKIMQAKEFLEKRSDSIESEIKTLKDGISSEREKISLIEQEMKNQQKDRDSRIREIEGDIGNIQIIDTKREETFNAMLERLNELRMRTENSLKSLDDKIKQISRIEDNLRDKVSKDNEAVFKRIGANHDELDDRITLSEKSMAAMNESFNAFSKNIGDHIRILNENSRRLSAIEKEISDHSTTQKSNVKGLSNISRNLDDIEERVLNSEKNISQLNGLVARTENLEKGFQQSIPLSIKDLKSELKVKFDTLAGELRSLAKETANEKERMSLLEQGMKNYYIDQRSKTKDIETMKRMIDESREGLSDSEKKASKMDGLIAEMRTRIMDEEAIAKRFEEQSKMIDTVNAARERLTRLEEKLKNQERDQDLRFNELIAVIKDLELGEAKRIEEFNSFADRFQKLRMKTEDNLKLFNQNVKKLSDIKSSIQSELSKENKVRIKELGLDFGSLKNRIIANDETIAKLNDSLEEHGLGLGALTERSKSAESQLGILSANLSSEKERTTELEKKLIYQEKSREPLFTNVNKLIKDLELGEAKRIREYNNFVDRFQHTKVKADEAIRSIKKEMNSLRKMTEGFNRKESQINDNINSAKEDLGSRISANEDMYDSEMDAFKNRLDYIANEFVTFKKQQQELYSILGIKKKEPELPVFQEPAKTELSESSSARPIVKKPDADSGLPYQ